MSDSAAVRQRRRRAHQRGDHSQCVGCDAVARALTEPIDPAGPNGSIADAVEAFVSRRSYVEGDPRGVMCAIATRLATELDTHPGPGMARELAGVINHLGDSEQTEADGLDAVRTKFHARRLAQLLGDLGNDSDTRRSHKP
jgi:hypothetical protein